MQLKSHAVNIDNCRALKVRQQLITDVFSQILWRLPLDFQRFALEQGLSSLFKATANLRSSSPPEASPRRNENSLAT